MADKKCALITGASGVLGSHIAKAFGDKGYNVCLTYLHNPAQAEALIKSIGSRAVAMGMDVSDAQSINDLHEKLQDMWGRLDLIVNNAGVSKDSLLIKQSEEQWDRILNVNLKGCFNIVRALSPLMVKSGGGHIINISSRTALIGSAGQAAYTASKAALVGLTFTLAKELASDNIKVNAVMPGYMDTEMGRKSKSSMAKAKSNSLFGVLSLPDEAASFMAWLSGTKNITGQVFVLDSRI